MSKIIVNKIGVIQGRLVPRESKKYQSFPFKNWKKELRFLKKINIKNVEWIASSEKKNTNPIFLKQGLRSILQHKKKFNLKIPSITVDYFMDNPFFKEKNLKKKNIILERIKKIIINSKKIGIKYIILPILENASISDEKEKNVMIKDIKKFIPILKKNKQMILFETDMKPKNILSFMNSFNKKFFGINYDAGNSAGLNYNLAEEKKYFNSVKNVHLKDKIKNGKSVPLGKGNANFKLLLRFLKNSNYKGNFILQTARSKKNQIQEVKKNLSYIKSIKF